MSNPPAAPREPIVFPARDQAFDLTAFPCPRCNQVVAAEFYGPCTACAAQLRVSQQGEATGVVAAAYEPKMNVTPNAVALKDD